MSAPATALNNPQRNVLLVTEERAKNLESAMHQSIAQRAYQLFEASGRVDGQQEAHWQQAEAEVLQSGTPPREAGSWFTINATLLGTDPRDVQVLVQADRAVVAVANRTAGEGAEHGAGKPHNSSLSKILLFRWPVRVDPATAAAYMKGETLVVTAKH